MAAALDSQRLGAIFQSRPDILEGIRRAADSPGRVALFNEIAAHVYGQLHEGGEPAQKRRRLDPAPAQGANGASAANGVAAQGSAGDDEVLLVVKEISLSAPQRKKFELCFTANFVYARAPGTTAPIPAITYAWRDVEHAFYLPVPDKAQPQHNYVLFPRGTCLPSKASPPSAEPLVFTVPSTPPKDGTIGGSEATQAAAVSDTYKALFHWEFAKRFKAVGSAVEVASADANEFHSVIRQAHRPGEPAVHVAGFRGSKDGFLFFLESGILWGFKKPLVFMPLSRIAAISYTNILQITFNMVVEVFLSEGEGTEELEFGMLDQQDYGGIDGYVKRNRLQDRSMAEQRKGKLQLAENRGIKKEGAGGEAGGAGQEDGLMELQRAEQAMLGGGDDDDDDDDDDEDEEDYDPGSDGESEGSGSSGDEEGEEGGSGDEDGDDDEAGDDDDEVGAGAEEEEEEAEVKAEPQTKPQKPARRTRAAPSAATQPRARQGWAAVSGPLARRAADVDMGGEEEEEEEEEEFDVVG